MDEGVVYLIASIEVIVAWVFSGLFIFFYAKGPWRSQLIGRVIMFSQIAMFSLLTYALISRWLEPVPEIQYPLGLTVYAGITVMQGFLLWALLRVRAGKDSDRG